MYAPVAAWFLERLLGAELVALGPQGAKVMVGITAASTLSVLIKDGSKPGLVMATLQFAKRGENIEERTLN